MGDTFNKVEEDVTNVTSWLKDVFKKATRAIESAEHCVTEIRQIHVSSDRPVCPTCGGCGRLGAAGHEVPCPSCQTIEVKALPR